MQSDSSTSGSDFLQFKKFMQQECKVSEKEWEITQQYFKAESFPKNEYFLKQGNVCRKMAFITDGVMRYCMFHEDGTEATCFFMSHDDFVGDPESFFPQTPSRMNIQALTHCRLITLTHEGNKKLFQYLERAKEIVAAIDHYVMNKMLYQRTFLLNLDAAVRYREFMKEFPHILQQVPLSYVANFLGITQQSLSRLRKSLSESNTNL